MMDRRTIVALALSFVVIIIYTRFIVPLPSKKNIPPGMRGETAPATATPKAEKVEGKKASPLEVATTDPLGKLSTVSTKTMEVTFSSEGACISRVKLFKSEVIKKGPIEIVSPLSAKMQPLAIKINEENDWGWDAVYDIRDTESGKLNVTFSRSSGSLTVTRSYRLAEEGYVVDVNTVLKNTGSDTLDMQGSIEISDGAIFALTASEKNSYIGIDRLDVKGKIARVGAGKLISGREELKATRWFALRNQFFALVMKPRNQALGSYAREVVLKDGMNGVEGGIMVGAVSLKPGESREIPISLYIGPKEYTALSAFNAVEVIDFGWFGFLGRWILLGLNWLYRICGNYGLAIILLTILIRVILYPLNQKSFKSMKQMQQLQPEIAALQQKYKGDQKRSQQEMMKLYREKGINPMGGCLPLLIQMPILVAFFRVLQNAIELWGAPFYFWITDLSEPDALFRFSTGKTAVPFIGKMVDGNGYILFNVLPILMLLVFYIQQKMTPSAMAATPEAQQQQKMMSVMMPVMFGVIFYNMPAGLNLYFAASTLLGIIQQKYMIR